MAISILVQAKIHSLSPKLALAIRKSVRGHIEWFCSKQCGGLTKIYFETDLPTSADACGRFGNEKGVASDVIRAVRQVAKNAHVEVYATTLNHCDWCMTSDGGQVEGVLQAESAPPPQSGATKSASLN